jgi:hypothetical protein
LENGDTGDLPPVGFPPFSFGSPTYEEVSHEMTVGQFVTKPTGWMRALRSWSLALLRLGQPDVAFPVHDGHQATGGGFYSVNGPNLFKSYWSNQRLTRFV